MAQQIEINKLDAFIQLGKVNYNNKPWERNKREKLNKIVVSGIESELLSGQTKNTLVFNSKYKVILSNLGFKVKGRKTKLANATSYLQKFILILFR